MAMKPEQRIRADAPSAMSDYPDEISDTTVIMAKERLVPEVIDQVTDKAAFKISFGEGMVLPGQLLSFDDIASEPKVDLTQVEAGGVYTFLIVDPDMPSPHKPDMKDVLVWMVNNIKGDDFNAGVFTVPYMAPEPTGKGTHRYAALLFQQKGFQQLEPPSKRAYFQTKNVAKEHGWGDPVAAVYYKCKHGQ